MENYLHSNKGKLIFLLLVGLAFSLVLKYTLDMGWKTFLSDLFFTTSMVFFLYGLWEYVLKVGFFNGFIYGARTLKNLFQAKTLPSEEINDDYIEFVDKRKKKYQDTSKYDIPKLLLIGLFFLIVSMLVSFLI